MAGTIPSNQPGETPPGITPFDIIINREEIDNLAVIQAIRTQAGVQAERSFGAMEPVGLHWEDDQYSYLVDTSNGAHTIFVHREKKPVQNAWHETAMLSPDRQLPVVRTRYDASMMLRHVLDVRLVGTRWNENDQIVQWLDPDSAHEDERFFPVPSIDLDVILQRCPDPELRDAAMALGQEFARTRVEELLPAVERAYLIHMQANPNTKLPKLGRWISKLMGH